MKVSLRKNNIYKKRELSWNWNL